MAGVWERNLEVLVRRQQAERMSLSVQVAAAQRALMKVAADLAAVEKRAASSAEDFKVQAEKLLSRRGDPEVWVRNYGAAVFAYHSPEKPCGWARDASSYKRMLLSDALDKGYQPCKSCGYRVKATAA